MAKNPQMFSDKTPSKAMTKFRVININNNFNWNACWASEKNEQQERNYVWAGKKLLVVTLHIMPKCTLKEVSL